MRRNKGKATGFLLEGWGEMEGGGGGTCSVFICVGECKSTLAALLIS